MPTRKHARLTMLGSRIGSLDPRTAQPLPKTADPFYLSHEWRSLISGIIRDRGRRCEECGRTHDGTQAIRIFGDHVVELKDGGAPLDPGNIRLLCGSCHTTKTVRERARRIAER